MLSEHHLFLERTAYCHCKNALKNVLTRTVIQFFDHLPSYKVFYPIQFTLWMHSEPNGKKIWFSSFFLLLFHSFFHASRKAKVHCTVGWFSISSTPFCSSWWTIGFTEMWTSRDPQRATGFSSFTVYISRLPLGSEQHNGLRSSLLIITTTNAPVILSTIMRTTRSFLAQEMRWLFFKCNHPVHLKMKEAMTMRSTVMTKMVDCYLILRERKYERFVEISCLKAFFGA